MATGFSTIRSSYDEGFTDCRFMGVAKWCDDEQVKEIVPDKADEIDDLVETGTDLINDRRVRPREKLGQHHREEGPAGRSLVHQGRQVALVPVCRQRHADAGRQSPFIDEKGKTFPRYRMFSASVDHDGDRYGFPRNLKSPQDEINHRRSKVAASAQQPEGHQRKGRG